MSSYFSYVPSSNTTEYDLPHPTLSRNQPRFYIPDRSSPPGEHLSLHSRFPSVTTSGQSTPYRDSLYGPSSRASLTALRHALHNYRSYTPRDRHHHIPDPTTPQHQMSSSLPRGQCPPPLSGNESIGEQPGQLLSLGLDDETVGKLPPNLWGIATEPMEALIDIHRVLYRGNEDIAESWSEQGREVQRVVDQWFEGDCVYDHPLVRLSSRQSVLTHFALLQLLSTLYLPTFYPSSIINHARNLSAKVRDVLIGSDEMPRRAEKAPMDPVDEWLATSGRRHSGVMRRNNQDNGWWKLWDVRAECRDIGCMECYEGYHIALIDHVISLTLFPSILKRRSGIPDTPSVDSVSSALEHPRTFVRTLAESVLHEFEFLMHWDLPVSTIVEFNEVGKATLVRDVVDVRDVIDTFVPFAKRFNWISRRLAGLVTSTIGSVALTLMPGHTVVFGDPIRVATQATSSSAAAKVEPKEIKDKADHPHEECKSGACQLGLGSAIGLDGATEPWVFGEPATVDEANSLGLEGMSGMEPDVDEETQE